jgi:hypothetical protein
MVSTHTLSAISLFGGEGRSTLAEILPRFITNNISHTAHKRIPFGRDPCVYVIYVEEKAGAGCSLGFITPRSGVQVSPPLPTFSGVYGDQRRSPFLLCGDFRVGLDAANVSIARLKPESVATV